MDLNKPYQTLEENFKKIDQMINLGSEVGNLTVNLLESLLRQYDKITGFAEFKGKLQVNIDVIKKIKDHQDLKKQYSVIYNQALVLLISNFESFLSEVAITIFDDYQLMVNWPDHKLSLDLSVFKYSSQTVGEIIWRSLREKYSFQDLQSTVKFLNEYLGLNIEMDKEMKEKIILYQALRHTIIHNLSKVDDKFLKQIRETEFTSNYSKGQIISISEKEYLDARKYFISFASLINENLGIRLNEVIPF